MPAGNPNYNALLSTTLQNYRDKFADNLSQSFLLMYWLTTQGRKIVEDGGESITVQLMYGSNTTVKSYSGYELLDTTPQEGMTAANYPWRQLSGSVSISREEERKNSGEQRLINLLEARVKQTEISLSSEMNRQWFGSGAGKDMLGLNLLVETTPASGGTVGGIARSDALNAWWRNQYIGHGGANLSVGGLLNIYKLYNLASRGNEHPDLGITTKGAYEVIEDKIAQNQRFVDSRVANSAFEMIKIKGAVVGYDEQCTATTFYWLNSDYLAFVVDKMTDLIMTDFVRPEDQDARVAQILLMGNLVLSNAARQGRLDNFVEA